MIVDLMRNDLSYYAKTGTILVPELCKIYSFEQVHQMISTITAQLKDTSQSIDALMRSFPPGSMTGAPKLEVINQLTQIEDFDRELYSGCIGYIEANGDFDFNVVIRTLFYDQKAHRASLSVGGAITYLSDPEAEWNECLIKAQSVLPFKMETV
jgi:para-aminobenzoate synthetase component 1